MCTVLCKSLEMLISLRFVRKMGNVRMEIQYMGQKLRINIILKMSLKVSI